MIAVNVTFHPLQTKLGTKPTIYEALSWRLGRWATDAECGGEVRRILDEAAIERMARGKGKR